LLRRASGTSTIGVNGLIGPDPIVTESALGNTTGNTTMGRLDARSTSRWRWNALAATSFVVCGDLVAAFPGQGGITVLDGSTGSSRSR
jgi:hypothetical protein